MEPFYQRLFRGQLSDGMPLPDVAEGSISAAPDRLREMLETMTVEVGADEFVLQDLIADPTDRQHSYRLIADAFDLPTRPMAAR